MFIPFLLVFISLLGFGSQIRLTKEDYGEELLKMMQMIHNDCIQITGVQDDLVEQIKDGNFIDDITIKKYVTCILGETIVNENGSLNTTTLEDYSPPKIRHKTPKIYGDCFDKNSDIDDPDERNYKFIQCVFETDEEAYLMF